MTAAPAPPPFRLAPLAPVALGLMLGIWADATLSVDVWRSTAIFACGVALVLVRPAPGRAACGLLAASAAVGALRHDAAFRRWPADHLARFVAPDDARLARLTGEIVSPITVDSEEAAARRGPFATEPRSRFLLDADSILQPHGATRVCGRVLVSVGAPALHLVAGQRVELLGRLGRMRGPDNPGQLDWSLRRRRDGVLLSLFCGKERNVRVLDSAHAFWPHLMDRARRSLGRLLIDECVAADETTNSLLSAMILGQRGQVERSLDDAFVRTGAVYFLCANGTHIAWLAALVWAIGFACGAHYRTTAFASLVVIAAYGLVAEPNPPILRSAITAGLFFTAQLLRRPRQTLNWLAAAVVVLLLVSPTDLFNAGFQFSFAVVAGLILLAPAAMQRLVPLQTFQVAGVEIPIYSSASELRMRLFVRRGLFAPIASITAWLVGLPITAWHFGRLCPWGWLNALLMAPLAFLVLVLGFVKLLLAALLPSLGGLLAAPLTLAASALARLATALSAIPGCNLDVPAPTPAWIVAYYAVLVLLVRGGRSKWLRRLAYLAVIPLLIGVFIPWRASPRRADELRVWSLAVGDGSATILELPNGRTIAYDLGTRGFYDPAASIILPFLHERGIRRLDTVVVTHPDFDHYGAIADVARAIPVGRVYVNPYFERFSPAGSTARCFIETLQSLHIPLDTLRARDLLPDTGDVRIECLWPAGDAYEMAQLTGDNDTSTVLRVAWQDRSILLTGDIAETAEAMLLQRAARGSLNLRSDVLSLPHHGSARAAPLPRFLDAVRAATIVRSTGQRDADTPERLWSAVGSRTCYSTAECGTVCVIIRDGRVGIETFRASNARPHMRGAP